VEGWIGSHTIRTVIPGVGISGVRTPLDSEVVERPLETIYLLTVLTGVETVDGVR
jgi:hypothetical protein